MLELSVDGARVTLQPERGARIAGLAVEDLELLVTPDADDHDYGVFPMAPWAGRVRDGVFTFAGRPYQLPVTKPPHAIHGTVRDHPWTVESASATSAVLAQVLADPWPFAGHVVMRFDLAPDSLALAMEVHADEGPMPASCGWHPWWNRHVGRGDPLEVELHAEKMYRRDGDDIPTGELIPIAPPPWDDCFTTGGTPAAVLHWPGAATLTMSTDCPCAVVYTEPDLALCVEPQSGPPDELNLRPHVVTPDAPLVVHTTWTWTLARP